MVLAFASLPTLISTEPETMRNALLPSSPSDMIVSPALNLTVCIGTTSNTADASGQPILGCGRNGLGARQLAPKPLTDSLRILSRDGAGRERWPDSAPLRSKGFRSGEAGEVTRQLHGSYTAPPDG